MQGSCNRFDLGQLKLLEKLGLTVSFIQRLGRKTVNNVFKPRSCNGELIRYEEISKLNGLIEKPVVIIHRHQAARQGIFGIKQIRICPVATEAEVMPQNTVIEQ